MTGLCLIVISEQVLYIKGPNLIVLSLPKTRKEPASKSVLLCRLFLMQLRRPVNAFHK